MRSIRVASRVAGWRIAVDPRSGSGRKPPHVEQVLCRERHAGKRTGIFVGRNSSIDGARLGARAIRGYVGERIQDRIEFRDACQRRVDDGKRRDLSARYRLRDVRGR